jgi:flagellar motor switch protein FliN
MFASCQVPIKESLGLDVKFSNVGFVEKDDIMNIFNGNEVNYWKVSIDLQDISVEEFVIVTPIGFCENASKDEEEVSIGNDYTANTEKQSKLNGTNGIQGYEGSNIDLILDVELPITIRIGSTEKKLVEIMRLGLGSIIELEKVVDDPVDVLVNNKLVAKGEVVVLDSNFAIRIIEVESKAKRIQSLA